MGSMLADFDKMIADLNKPADEEEEFSGSLPDCFVCGNPGKKWLCHGSDGCRLPICIDCGDSLMSSVAAIIAAPEDSELMEMVRAYCGDQLICRFCHQENDLVSARLEEPDA